MPPHLNLRHVPPKPAKTISGTQTLADTMPRQIPTALQRLGSAVCFKQWTANGWKEPSSPATQAWCCWVHHPTLKEQAHSLSAQPKKIYTHNRNKPVGMQSKHPANATPVVPFIDCPFCPDHNSKQIPWKSVFFPAQILNKTESLLQNGPSGLTDASTQALSATVSPIKR